MSTTIQNAVSNLPTHTELQSIVNHLCHASRGQVAPYSGYHGGGPMGQDSPDFDSGGGWSGPSDNPGPWGAEEAHFSDEWGDKLLSEIDSIIQEFEGNLLIEECGGRGGECPYQHIWNKRKTKGIILEKHCGDKWAKKGLLTSQYTTGRGRLLEEWRDASVLGWTEPFGKTSHAKFRRQFDLRGKSKEDLRKIIRLIIE